MEVEVVLQPAPQERHRDGSLGCERVPVQCRERLDQCRHVAAPVGEQVMDDVIRQTEATSRGIGGQRLVLVGIGKRHDLVDQPPAQPRAQILAQRQGRQ